MQNHQTAYNLGRQIKNYKPKLTRTPLCILEITGSCSSQGILWSCLKIVSWNYYINKHNLIIIFSHSLREKSKQKLWPILEALKWCIIHKYPCQQMTKCTGNLKTPILAMICTGGGRDKSNRSCFRDSHCL